MKTGKTQNVVYMADPYYDNSNNNTNTMDNTSIKLDTISDRLDKIERQLDEILNALDIVQDDVIRIKGIL